MNKSQVSVSYLKLLLKESGPANNRYFMGILPNYIDIVTSLISSLIQCVSLNGTFRISGSLNLIKIMI